jgi:hypothetical protein
VKSARPYDAVDEKERLLRARGLDDLFAGMKAEENAIAAALFPRIAAEIDDIWAGLPLPRGGRLVTWTTPAVINRCSDCKITL